MKRSLRPSSALINGSLPDGVSGRVREAAGVGVVLARPLRAVLAPRPGKQAPPGCLSLAGRRSVGQ